MDWFEELMYNGGDNESKERMITSKQLNKIVDIIPTTVLRGLSAKEVKTVPDDSIYIGTDMASYGDWNFYITTDGDVVCTYYSIGD
jgi:hypothetical protein